MKSRRTVWLGLAAIGIAGAAFLAGRAIAAGIPTGAGAMKYSGLLENSSGAPLTGAHDVVFALWDNGQPATGNPRCNVQNPSGGYDLGTTGHFTIDLPDTCTAAVRAHPNLWVELTVDSTVLPRTKLGAVPYAVEADRAVTADSMAFEGFSFRTSNIVKPTGWGTVVAATRDFNTFGNAYNPTTGVFTAPKPGYYRFSVGGLSSTFGSDRVTFAFYTNGVRLFQSGGGQLATGDSPLGTFTEIKQLAAGDEIQPGVFSPVDLAFQGTGTTAGYQLQFQGEFLGD